MNIQQFTLRKHKFILCTFVQYTGMIVYIIYSTDIQYSCYITTIVCKCVQFMCIYYNAIDLFRIRIHLIDISCYFLNILYKSYVQIYINGHWGIMHTLSLKM